MDKTTDFLEEPKPKSDFSEKLDKDLAVKQHREVRGQKVPGKVQMDHKTRVK